MVYTVLFSCSFVPYFVGARGMHMLQKALRKEDGLQGVNGRANAEARRRTGILFSSDEDRHYVDDFDAKNHLGKADELKFLP